MILASLQVFGARAEDCLLIGDSAADMEAGKRAGVKTCAVLWGYGERDDLARANPDYWAANPSDFLA